MEFFRTKRSADDLVLGTVTRTLDLSHATPLTTRGRWGARRGLLSSGTQLHLGRYTVQGILGKGGEGVVYRAFDGERRQHVALKVLHVPDSSGVPQLKREFRFLRDLIHPGLVPLYELVVDAELSFYTMALVDGRDFFRATTDEASLRRNLLQLTEVLAFLHETGRVHRDIKGTNVLVRPDDRLVLVDFGVGLDLGQRNTRERGLLGTPRYMAPELLALQQASPKSDAYAVGVMLFEALVGEHPEPTGLPNLGRNHPPRVHERKAGVAADLSEICEKLLEPDPNERWAMADVLVYLGQTAAVSVREDSPGSRSAGKRAPFSGRALELGRLEDAFERAVQESEPVLAVLEAPSGHGKTATLQAFLARHPEALILKGRCSEHELVAHKAIDGVVESLFDYLLGLEEFERVQLVPPDDGLLLGQLFPELSAATGQSPLPPDAVLGDPRASRVRAYQALARVLVRLGRREALIITIDDLQWGDVDSGKLLLETFSLLERPRCLLILAHRSDEAIVSPCLRELFGHERSLGEVLITSHIKLLPLDDREARSLVGELLNAAAPVASSQGTVPPELVNQIVSEAGGSPLLLTEIASHVAAKWARGTRPGQVLAAPQQRFGLDEIVRTRCEELTPASYDAFQLLCCSGSTVAVRRLADMVRVEPDVLVRDLELQRLVRQRAGGMKLEVVHDAIREAMLRAVAGSLRGLHQRLAQNLESEGGDPAEIARHYAEAGLAKRSSLWAERAGDAASRSFALEHAVRVYRMALDGTPRQSDRWPRLREKLASALADAGLGAEAAPIFADLAEHAPEGVGMQLRTRAAEQWLITGDAGRGSELLAQVQERAGLTWPGTPGDALRTLLVERARIRAARLIPVSLRRAPSQKLQAQLEACRAAWSVSFISTIHGAANSSRYLRLAIKSGDPQHLAIGHGMEAMYLAAQGAHCRPAVERALATCRRQMPAPETGYNAAFLKYASGQCSFLLGDFRAALIGYSDAESAFLASCRNVSWELNSGRIFLGNVLYELGHHRELDRRYADWRADAEERGDSYMGAAIPIAQARRCIIRTGDLVEAQALINDGVSRWTSPYKGFHHFSAMVCRSLVALIAQRPADTLDILRAGTKELEETHHSRVQILRVHFETQTAYASIELAADAKKPGERRRLLRLARRCAAKLHDEGAPHTKVRADLVYAAIAFMEAPTETAILRLRDVEQRFARIGHELESAAVAARLSELIGGDEGDALRAKAHSRFQEADAIDWTCALSGFAPRFLPGG